MCSLMGGLIGLSTMAQVQAQRQQISAQAAQAEAQARQAEINAQIQARQSEQIADQYAQKQKQLQNQFLLMQGQNNASAGASGVSSTTGSAFDVLESSREAYLEDSRELLNNQRNAVFGSHVDEYNLRQQAANYRAEASNARRGGKWAVIGTILGGASSLYTNLNTYRKAQPVAQKTPYNPFAGMDMPDFRGQSFSYGYKPDWNKPQPFKFKRK